LTKTISLNPHRLQQSYIEIAQWCILPLSNRRDVLAVRETSAGNKDRELLGDMGGCITKIATK
jgi:hypothetical protein